jgi:hypothetical protein
MKFRFQALAPFLMLSGVLSLAGAKEIDFAGGVTFNAPDEFTPLTPDEVAAKFPQRSGPLEAIGNESRDVSISYSLTATAVQPEQLADLKNALTTMLPKLRPGLQFITNVFVEINGTKWIEMESVLPEGGQKIHNIQLMTSYEGKLLAFNFNSTVPLFDSYKDKLNASINSITITRPPAAGPGPASSPGTTNL